MTTTSAEIIDAALAATTRRDADQLQQMIVGTIGDEYRRPVGDKHNNFGLMGASGSYDLKLIENVTNMQDSVLERFALQTFGSRDRVPYETPHRAAKDLLKSLSPREQSLLATVTFRDSDPPVKMTKCLSVIFRDKGCGMEPAKIPQTVFGLGGSHKEDALFLQGAFGMGGAMTYRNAGAVVLVSRRDPSLLDEGSDDRISVAVVQWQENTKGKTAYYLVDRDWSGSDGVAAEPWSCSADEYPDFEPGTHLALISYRVDGIHRQREGDERTFDVVTNTRLYNPVLPIRFVNEITRSHAATLQGLRRRLENSEYDFRPGQEILPFNHGGKTHLLPVHYFLLGKRREAGGRDKFLARDHAVLFTSNGQVHHHWTERQVRDRTALNKLHDRLLVVVETDALPIRLRTSLFTADRNELVRGDAALRLEEAVWGVIRDSTMLREANNELLRESYKETSSQSSVETARRISRALSVKGFSIAAGHGSGGGSSSSNAGRAGGGGGSLKPVTLHQDPTSIDGPAHIHAVVGDTKSITYTVDVVDSFYQGRGSLRVVCDHPDIAENREITVAKGRSGRVRVMVAVPDTAELGSFELHLFIEDWMRVAGGLGRRIEHVTKLELVDDIPGSGRGMGKRTQGDKGSKGAGEGGQVALIWRNPDEMEAWERITVGAVESVPARILAETQAQYQDLQDLGDTPVPTILLNREYPPFKKYLASRNRELTSIERPMDQYAVGVGVSLILMQRELDRKKEAGEQLPEENFLGEMQRSAARAVLAVMPSFDELAKEAGLQD